MNISTPEELAEFYKGKAVKAESVEDFLDKYYRPDRFHTRGNEYVACLIKSNQEDVTRFGYCIISKFDSITGRVVAYFPNYQLDHSREQHNAIIAKLEARIKEYEDMWGSCTRHGFLKLPVELRRKVLKLQAQTLTDNIHDSQAKDDLRMMD